MTDICLQTGNTSRLKPLKKIRERSHRSSPIHLHLPNASFARPNRFSTSCCTDTTPTAWQSLGSMLQPTSSSRACKMHLTVQHGNCHVLLPFNSKPHGSLIDRQMFSSRPQNSLLATFMRGPGRCRRTAQLPRAYGEKQCMPIG
jgi:hypothetical protein